MNHAARGEFSGRGLPLPGDDIDTDRIIPGRFLRCVTFDGIEQHLFADDRRQNRDHPFDQAQYRGASILIVGRNFGCGSSREHAPQALHRWGIRWMVGESFAEIFFSNCTMIGIPCLTVAGSDAQWLIDAIRENPGQALHLSLESMTVRLGDRSTAAGMPEGTRKQFLEGTWNSTQTLSAAADEIERTANSLPYVTGF